MATTYVHKSTAVATNCRDQLKNGIQNLHEPKTHIRIGFIY